jgi:hypothetical protein
MKRILSLLTLTLFVVSSLMAQKKKLLCHKHHSHSNHCYLTRYAQNYKVCKDELGYRICGEERRKTNSTWPIGKTPFAPVDPVYAEGAPVYSMKSSQTAMPQVLVPVNQSIPVASGVEVVRSGSYAAYRTRGKGKIKVCYIGDNIAELNKNPYQGCAADQWDGVERNNTRNLNVNQPVHLAPSAGNGGWGF